MSARKRKDQRIELVDEVINYREVLRTRKHDKKNQYGTCNMKNEIIVS